MIDLLSMDQSDMETFLITHGFPKFRGKQLYQWLHKQEVFSFDAMTNLPKRIKWICPYIRSGTHILFPRLNCRGDINTFTARNNPAQ